MLSAVPSATILRPSVVFGPEDEFTNRFAALARMSPALPLIGGGVTKLQPVYVGDVATAVAEAVDGKAKAGATYELGGPEVLSMREIMEAILEITCRDRMLVPLPFGLAKLQALFLQFAPGAFKLTPDQVELLRGDNVVSEAAKAAGLTLEGLGIAPDSLEGVAPQYLWRFRKAGQFTHKERVNLSTDFVLSSGEFAASRRMLIRAPFAQLRPARAAKRRPLRDTLTFPARARSGRACRR